MNDTIKQQECKTKIQHPALYPRRNLKSLTAAAKLKNQIVRHTPHRSPGDVVFQRRGVGGIVGVASAALFVVIAPSKWWRFAESRRRLRPWPRRSNAALLLPRNDDRPHPPGGGDGGFGYIKAVVSVECARNITLLIVEWEEHDLHPHIVFDVE